MKRSELVLIERSVWLFILTLLVIACKKESNNVIRTGKAVDKPTKYIGVSSELKEWAYFKQGSYWIVKDSVNQQIDSVFVSSVSTRTIEKSYSKDSTAIVEEITINFSSAPTSTILFPYKYNKYIISSYIIDHVEEPEYKHFTVFQIKPTPLQNIGNGLIQFENIPTLTIGPSNYSNVIHVHYAYTYAVHSAPNGWYGDESYWQKNIGMIKKRGHFGYAPDLFEVIRYNIVQ